MLLLLEHIRRLSIDVDIACTLPGGELEPVLQEIGRESRFESFEVDRRDPDRLPKRSHYKFTYTSAISGKPNDPSVQCWGGQRPIAGRPFGVE